MSDNAVKSGKVCRFYKITNKYSDFCRGIEANTSLFIFISYKTSYDLNGKQPLLNTKVFASYTT